jgi:mycothiol synthase
MELKVERQDSGPSVVHVTLSPGDDVAALEDGLALGANAGADAPIWIHGSSDSFDEVMVDRGFTSDRTLLQMRRPLPAAPSGLVTRAFTPEDVAEFVAVNNRAFSWHPEQSGLTAEGVRNQMEEQWFDAEGFRLHHIDGRLAGFCWTKVHTDPEQLGEIYVIALDPDFHGRGLGKPMTLAGLEHLSAAGLKTAMLYVESDNTSAVATYESLGFGVHRTDKMWQRP